jgi:hypothetical protein
LELHNLSLVIIALDEARAVGVLCAGFCGSSHGSASLCSSRIAFTFQHRAAVFE